MPGTGRPEIRVGTAPRRGAVLAEADRPGSPSERDAHCGLEKTVALADAVPAVAGHCRRLVDAGVPTASVEEIDFGPLSRAREDTGPHDAAAWRAG